MNSRGRNLHCYAAGITAGTGSVPGTQLLSQQAGNKMGMAKAAFKTSVHQCFQAHVLREDLFSPSLPDAEQHKSLICVV